MTDSDDRQSEPRQEGAEFGLTQKQIERSEKAMVETTKAAFALWSAGFEMMKQTVQDWATRRQTHILESLNEIQKAQQLESIEERTEAISQVAHRQVELAFKDFTSAGLKALTYAGAVAQNAQEKLAQAQAARGSDDQ